MKFGKTIQARQIPGWGTYYLDYKFLKKIINSLAAHRPASEASQLALGIRPRTSSSNTSSPDALGPPGSNIDQSALNSTDRDLTPINIGSFVFTPSEEHSGFLFEAGRSLGAGGVGVSGLGNGSVGRDEEEVLEPLPPGTGPPEGGLSINGAVRGRDSARDESFKAHRAVFFFKLGREIEKINAFYLAKERDLRLRVLTLLNNRKRLLVHLGRSPSTQEDAMDISSSLGVGDQMKKSTEWQSLEEGWRLFEKDLGKLQQFIEINATGFRKILKKWDKRSKSNTKELYLERQVEVQPCFNREYIAKMADIAAANLLDLEHGSAHLSTSFLDDLVDTLGADHLGWDSRSDFDQQPSGQIVTLDAVSDLEFDLDKAVQARNTDVVEDWIRQARSRQLQEKEKAQRSSHRLMRLLWRATEELPSEYLQLMSSSIELDFGFIDDINGRTPLHEACMSGRIDLVQLCLAKGVNQESEDVYERRPLHYAATEGATAICALLLDAGAQVSPVDMDGHTPLMQAIITGRVDTVGIFLRITQGQGILGPTAFSSDLIPLSLACQYGHLDVARLLLQHGGKVLPNSEGLYPQHLAARAGHADICSLLIEKGGPSGGGKDRHDKYNQWTPLHYASVGGKPEHVECARVLVEAGCDVNAVDEYGKSAGFYAAWYGQIDCLKFLIDAGAKLEAVRSPNLKGKIPSLGLGEGDAQGLNNSPGSDAEDDPMDLDGDLIPSLSLPPPIIPLRMYGHDFLARQSLVQITLGHPLSEASNEKQVFPVKLYNRSGDDNLLNSWSSLKLVMSSKWDASATPHSVVLPLADEREVFGFRVDDLSTFVLELSLYPTFGSKVIGRAVVLPFAFLSANRDAPLIVALLDHQLKAIGEVAFRVQCVKPFKDAQLEIGGKVETYWKSTVMTQTTTLSQDHAHQFQPHRPLSVSTNSASLRSPQSAGTPTPSKESAQAPGGGGFVTSSSLAGEYLRLVVQITRDYKPVICSEWKLPMEGLDFGVSDVTAAQLSAIGIRLGRDAPTILESVGESMTIAELKEKLDGAMGDLARVLATLPIGLGVNLEVRYAGHTDAEREGVVNVLDMNRAIDAVLDVVYDSARSGAGATNPERKSRKIVMSSFDNSVASHIQLKQPNFAVFYGSYSNVTRHDNGDTLTQADVSEESLSVRETVKVARNQNMLGVVLDCRILALVPSLVQSVKDAGLLLIALGSVTTVNKLKRLLANNVTIDGYSIDNIITLTA